MRKYQSGGVTLQSLLHDFARVYRGAVEGAAEEFDELDHPMPVVKKQAAERFEFARSESQGQKIPGCLRRRQGATAPYAARDLLARRSDDFLCRGGYWLAGSAEREQWFPVRHRRSPWSRGGIALRPAVHAAAQPSRLALRATRRARRLRRAQGLDGETGVGGLISRQARPSLLSDLF